MAEDNDAIMATAGEYCSLIETAGDDDDRWLTRLLELLPRLHATMALLDSRFDGDGEPMTADLDARFEQFTRLRRLLGDRDSYWMQYDVAQDGQQMSGSLADDLTDIYCELKFGLMRLQQEHDPSPTLQNWRHGYRVHWGQHLVDAERHLFELSARNELVSQNIN